MSSSRQSFRIRFLIGFLICAGLLAFALYAEYVLGMEPCPLCIFQRIGFIIMGVFFLLGGLHNPRAGGRWFYTSLILLGALFGLAVAGRHLWIQSLPADQIPACGPNLGYMFDAFPLSKVLKMVFTGSGECAKVQPVLGLPMPFWSLLWYMLLSAWAIHATLKRVKTRLWS